MIPRSKAEQVAIYVRQILDKDKLARKILYKEIGLPEDKTVK